MKSSDILAVISDMGTTLFKQYKGICETAVPVGGSGWSTLIHPAKQRVDLKSECFGNRAAGWNPASGLHYNPCLIICPSILSACEMNDPGYYSVEITTGW